MDFIQKILITALLVACSFSSVLADETYSSLQFATILKEERPHKVVLETRPFLNRLENFVSIQVNQNLIFKSNFFKNSSLFAQALSEKQIDLTRLTPEEYIEIKKNYPSLYPLGIEVSETEKTLKGIFFVKADSSIQAIKDLYGASVAFGKEGSLVGQYFPQYQFIKNKILASDLGPIQYFDSSAEIVFEVTKGQMQIGVIPESDFNRLNEGQITLRAIDTFEYPGPVWAMRNDLPQPLVRAFKNGFYKFRQSDELKSLGAKQLRTTNDHDFDETRMAIWFNWLFYPVSTGQ